MVLLCVPRQGEGGGGLSLTPAAERPGHPERPSWLKRIGWLVLIWALSVGALGLFALAFRVIMRSVGLSP